MHYRLVLGIVVGVLGLGSLDHLAADPCGMVPPVYPGQQVPLTRKGLQKTYVFYKDGVETFVIRPGFTGRIDEFGMLIPFPTAPAVRKVPDHIFAHIAAAVDPPEVIVDLLPRPEKKAARKFNRDADGEKQLDYFYDQVKVIRQEAVGMYEVAVLEAGSAAALKRWMDQHGYRYPKGMDKPCNDYVAQGWCFVAIKTKVGQKAGVDPQPGQRTVESKLPTGSTFDGAVQAMGFRFRVKELVVPMRLSAFNEGELRNVVYLLTDGPRKIRMIPEEYVVRQVSGERLYKNLTELLPLRIIGGSEKDIPEYRRQALRVERDPEPRNGAAGELFASDLLAVSTDELALTHEELEKELLRIGERVGLRGPDIDKLNIESLAQARRKTVEQSLVQLKSMTLTVVDGDFPRELLAKHNLTFAEYRMPANRNGPESYDAKVNEPAPKKRGILNAGALLQRDTGTSIAESTRGPSTAFPSGMLFAVFATLIAVGFVFRTRFVLAIFSGCLLLAICVEPADARESRKPDIILIVADNLGHGDLSCYGCPDIRTPNIDQIAADGVRFTNFYSNGPECSPTRTALLTGRYQQRLLGLECALGTGNVGRYDDAIALADRHELGLPPKETILIPLLNEAGYRTVGLGKWHLGYEKHLFPPHHGFDYFLASLGGTIDYFYHNEPTGERVLYENHKQVRHDRYFTDLISERAVQFVLKQPADEPLFLYLPFTAPSAPFQHPDQKPDRPKVSTKWDSKDWQKGDRQTLRLIVERLDQGVGKILQALQSSGRAEHALVIFCSDNGAYPIAASNAPFRGHASELFEGGIHVACMARWPGKLPQGAVDARPTMTFDLTASILAAAGCTLPEDRPLDGVDVLGQVAAGRVTEPRTLFWRSRRADRTWKAVRRDTYKYVWRRDGDQLDEYLFNLDEDQAETTNLIAARPDQARLLKRQLAKWEAEMKRSSQAFVARSTR